MPKESTDTYGPPITKQYGKFIVTVHHPILTDEERERRMERIKSSALAVLREKYEREAEMQAQVTAAV